MYLKCGNINQLVKIYYLNMFYNLKSKQERSKTYLGKKLA